MKYTKQEWHWKDILRIIMICSPKFIAKLESLNFYGTEKHCKAYVGKIPIIIYGAEQIKNGSKINVVLQKRNDGIKQIRIFAQNDSPDFVGIEMEERIAVENILNFLEACHNGKKQILEELYG